MTKTSQIFFRAAAMLPKYTKRTVPFVYDDRTDGMGMDG